MESFIFKCLFFFNLGFDKRCQRTFVLLETSALMSFCINETRRETAAVKKIKRSESNVSEQIYQWAHTLIVWLCLFVRLITSRCQLQGSGTAGLKTAPATRNMPGSRGASWPCMPLGFRSLRHIRGTLTDSLLCVRAHNHTHWDMQTHRQLTTHICSCIIFTQLPMCAHALHIALRLGHTILHMCAQAWLNSLFRPKKENPKPNVHLVPCKPTESVFQFFFVIPGLSGCQQPVICYAVWKWQSHAATILISSTSRLTIKDISLWLFVTLPDCISYSLLHSFQGMLRPDRLEFFNLVIISRQIDKEYPFIYCVFCW